MILCHQIGIAFIAVVQVYVAVDVAGVGILPHTVACLGIGRAADIEVCDPDVIVLQNRLINIGVQKACVAVQGNVIALGFHDLAECVDNGGDGSDHIY